jgi:hypothetical protein
VGAYGEAAEALLVGGNLKGSRVARFRIDGGSGDGEPMPGTILLIQRFGIGDAIG